MKKFKIYGFLNNNPILITDSNNLSSAATFEESMNILEHMKSTLSFKISDTLANGKTNSFMELVYPAAKFRLKLEDNDTFKIYDFIVKGISPEFYKDIIVYSVSLEDYASVIYSKEGQGLTLEYTGTIEELGREILLKTRKNLGYRGLNKNYLIFNTYTNLVNVSVKDYSLSLAEGLSGSITFSRQKDQGALNYNLYMNALAIPSTKTTVSITQLDSNGLVISTSTPVDVTAIGLITIPFLLSSGAAYYRINFTNIGTGKLSLTDFKLNLQITPAIQAIIDQGLKISDSFDINDFKGELGDTSYYKKVTLSLSNSNLYNALIELAKVFNAELVFDYIGKSINFLNKDTAFQYKGLKFSPTFNLMSLSREENTDELNSVLNVTGNSNVYSIFPTMTSEWKQYLQTCVNNGFIGPENFETYKDYPLMKNLITNGDFSNGTTGWTAYNSTISSTSNTLSFIATVKYGYAFKPFTPVVQDLVNHKIYYSAQVKTTKTSVAIALFRINQQTIGSTFSNGLNTFQRLSNVATIASTANTNYAFGITDNAPSAFASVEAKNFIALDLTVIFGAGNEPTKEVMDAYLVQLPDSWFDNYLVTNYSGVAEYIIATANPVIEADRQVLVRNFAIAADKVPNLENTLYSLDYFKDIEKISESEYTSFNVKINDELRKENIKLRLYGDRYQNASSQLSSKDSQIDFYTRNLVVENIAINNIDQEIIDKSIVVNSEEWIPLENARNTSLEEIYNGTQDLLNLYGLTYDINLNPTGIEIDEYPALSTKYRLSPNSYTSLALNVYGYYNIYKNGIQQKIDEVKETIRDLGNTKIEQEARVIVLQTLIDKINDEEDPRSIEAVVERDGLQAQIDASIFNIGEYTTDIFNPTLLGMYHYQLYYLEQIMLYLGSYSYKSTLLDYSVWDTGTPTIGDWTSTGSVNTVEEPNKDNNNDIMMSLANNGVVNGRINSDILGLFATKNYRATCLIKVPSMASGTFTISVNTTIPRTQTLVLSPVSGVRWIGLEFYTSENLESAAYSFPSNTKIATTETGDLISNGDYIISYTWTSTTPIHLYRPRFEEVSTFMPTIEDMYYLYDNPLMLNFTETLTLEFKLIEGLYDLLYNENYANNVNIAKENTLNYLDQNYEIYLINGYYENADEISSEGLLEQALVSFAKNKYPKINYGISVIDLSALDGYKYLNLNVNDKIEIAEPNDRLYKTYQPENINSTKYLQVSQISYNLRQPESTSLTVAEDDEMKKILQYILKATY